MPRLQSLFSQLFYKLQNQNIFQMKKQSIIMATVDKIFDVLGYRRYISGIQTLQSQQIYFQICNFLFPSSYFHIFKINQTKTTTSHKIQQIIDIISQQINMDLTHISGLQITNGNLNHIHNLLQLLQELSVIIGKGSLNMEYQIKSLPVHKQSILISQNQNSFYRTVIGNPGQFIYTQFQSTNNQNIMNVNEEQNTNKIKSGIKQQQKNQKRTKKQCTLLKDQQLHQIKKIQQNQMQKKSGLQKQRIRFNKSFQLNINKKIKSYLPNVLKKIYIRANLIQKLNILKINDIKIKQSNFKKQITSNTLRIVQRIEENNEKINKKIKEYMRDSDKQKQNMKVNKKRIKDILRKQQKNWKQYQLNEKKNVLGQQKIRLRKMITQSNQQIQLLLQQINQF